MSENKKTYDTKELFKRGLLLFWRAMGAFFNPMMNHATFRTQCAARRAQRKLEAAR